MTYAQLGRATILGQSVTNTASVSYTDGGGNSISINTNRASFEVKARRTPSTVDFFRHTPGIDSDEVVMITGTDFSTDGSAQGSFIAMQPPKVSVVRSKTTSASNSAVTAQFLDTSKPLALTMANGYLSGEVIFVRVTDIGYNIDRTSVETILAEVRASSGDMIILRLYESGPDTGKFWGYVQSTVEDTQQHDEELTTRKRDTLKVIYTDSQDRTEISIDTALVDAYGRVFNSASGDMVEQAVVTLMDKATNQPASVMGIDGLSQFPSSVSTGQTIHDASGVAYVLAPGEFIFPLTAAGEYYLKIDTPAGLTFASALKANDFVALPNAPFNITKASYGDVHDHKQFGILSFDIPLDHTGQFIVSKTTSSQTGDIGDVIAYKVDVSNRSDHAAPVVMRDTMPRGFLYKSGSAKRDGLVIPDPILAVNRHDLNFNLGVIGAGETLSITYVLEIGANAKLGRAVNSIVVINGNGIDVSNIARAEIRIKEDLFRTNSTIVGLVAEEACAGDDQWVREIRAGRGVEGVRIYTETGAYAISDKDGQFHFQGVTPGSHVIQLDEETLPLGYTPMVCEQNSQYAGSAISKFVDVQGAGIWRANFYLKKTGQVEKIVKTKTTAQQKEYKKYGRKWLETQNASVAWVYPSIDRTPSARSANIGIKHGPEQSVELMLNAIRVPTVNFEAKDSNKDRSVMLSRWRSVDILDGRNVFTARIKNKRGEVVETLVRELHFVKNIARAIALPDRSVLAADGRSVPKMAIRLEDEAGRPVYAGRTVKISIESPYVLHNKAHFEGGKALITPFSASSEISVGEDGIAHVALEPTLKSGKVTLNVTLDDGRIVPISMYLTPEKRDWILVGLAEGSVAHASLTNKTIALASGETDGLMRDGRVAFFAKGMVKGNWLLTLAADTDKRRGKHDGDFGTQIDPNAYYTLYGDRSYTEIEASSRYPFYIKLEKSNAYALFGDFDTNITEGKLTRYSRRLSGIKGEYLGTKFQAMGYVAQTNQGFAKAEIAADGTSGPYVLSNAPVLANSEKIIIETRDRVRADEILQSRTMVRHIDYTLDNDTGAIIFRLPVDVSDASFNPNVIVVDYETDLDAERHTSFGGRVQANIMRGRVQVGSSFVHEGGSSVVREAKATMVGLDMRARIVEGTELRAEFAHTRNRSADGGPSSNANAYLAELVHTSDRLSADAYFRQEEAGYGLGQLNSNTGSVRRYGANVSYKIQELENAKTGNRIRRLINGSVYKEDNLSTGNSRLSSEINLSQEGQRFSASVGVRAVKDQIVGQADRQTILGLISAKFALPKFGTNITIAHERSLSSNDGEQSISDHPTRTRIRLDKDLTTKARLHLTHEILQAASAGGDLKSHNTALGLTYRPWSGSTINAASDMTLNDSSRRIGATFGLDQQLSFGDHWSASVGLTSRYIVSDDGTFTQIAPDNAISILETNEKFMSGYLGLGYRTPYMSTSARIEARKSDSSDQYVLNLAATREVSKQLSFAGAWRSSLRQSQVLEDGVVVDANTSTSEARLAGAWRPNDHGLILLNRFDYRYENLASGEKSVKLINNLAANAQLSPRLQMSFNYGLKYSETDLLGDTHKGFTQLFGTQTRFDLTDKVDFGLHASAIKTHNGSSMQYAFGPSLGVSPVKNVWASVGYNLVGYRERDFMAAQYASHGAYLQFRIKFDQNTAQGLLDIVSP